MNEVPGSSVNHAIEQGNEFYLSEAKMKPKHVKRIRPIIQ